MKSGLEAWRVNFQEASSSNDGWGGYNSDVIVSYLGGMVSVDDEELESAAQQA